MSNPNADIDIRFAVSTCVFAGKTLTEIDVWALDADITVELSSGYPYSADLVPQAKSMRCRRLVHNYFPPPKIPFVLNLASLDPAVWQRSIEHGRTALALAKAVNCPFYSVHAGFCTDPDVNKLGKKFSMTGSPPREKHWDAFLRAVDILLKEAKSLGLSLFIENNVTIVDNVLPSGESLLLCDSPQDVERLLSSFKDKDFSLLLDTGHLNVSSKTHGYDPEEMLAVAEGRVGAIHHNDNNGKVDNNVPLTESYWFLPHVKRFRSAMHVLEVLRQTPQEIFTQKALLEKAAQ